MSKCEIPKIGCVNHDCDECKKPLNPYRNQVLEEVAKRFDEMKSLGDTAASFAAYVRGMKE